MAHFTRPFTTFNFRVALQLGEEAAPVCNAEFAECDGLEMSLDAKTIREGGNNARQIHLAGPVSYGALTLKRGMTDEFGLWEWFGRVQSDRSLRGSGEVIMLAADGETEKVRFVLTGCLPTKLKAPSLNAASGIVAIEEMQLAYETLEARLVPEEPNA